MSASPRTETFLDPPDETARNRWRYPELPPVEYDIEHEARCSTLIERETSWRANLAAINTEGRGVEMLLKAHYTLFRGDSRFRGGRFRQHNVTVGAFTPPPWEIVPRLMDHLDAFIQDASVPLLLRAVWGHIQFETIHPFPDGNGRLGRLLVNKMLERPWSHAVLRDHHNYYRLLEQAQWQPWAAWMTKTLAECPTHPDQVPPPPIFPGQTWSEEHHRIYREVAGKPWEE